MKIPTFVNLLKSIFMIMYMTSIIFLTAVIVRMRYTYEDKPVGVSLLLPDHFKREFQGKVFEGKRFSNQSIAIAKHIVDLNFRNEHDQEMIDFNIFKQYPVFVTAFSTNHFREGYIMLESFYKVYEKRARIIMYDIGLR